MASIENEAAIPSKVAGDAPVIARKRAGDEQLPGVEGPWQTELAKVIDGCAASGDDYNVIYICDEGNTGKRFFTRWMEQTRNNVVVIADGNDMVGHLCGVVDEGWEGIVLVDGPRAAHAEHWLALARGITTIKQGFLHDERNGAKKIIEPPIVVCFMNTEPPEGCMMPNAFKRWDTKTMKFIE